MSLLQEALKRQEDDKNQPGQPAENAAATPPVVPEERNVLSLAKPAGRSKNADGTTDVPAQSMPVTEGLKNALPGGGIRRKSSAWWIIVSLLFLCVALVIAVGVAFFLAPQMFKSSPRAAAGSALPAGAIVIPEPQKSAQPSLSKEPGGSSAQKEQKDTALMPAGTQAVGPVASSGTNAAQQVSNETAVVQAPSPAPVARKVPASKPPPPPQAKWPILKLNGILRSAAGGASTALINGKIYSAGQTVQDVKIVEVKADGVILKYAGETRFVRVGTASY